MSKKGVFGRLWSRLRPSRDTPQLVLAPENGRPPAAPAAVDAWLSELVTAVGEGKRKSDIGQDEFWRHVDRLWQSGHEKLAAEWLEKLLASQEVPATATTSLRARLVEMLEDRGDSNSALPHLKRLLDEPEHCLRANYLLAEHHRRLGQEAQALRHYEAVLARDVDYPNVRVRVERLRAARGHDVRGSQGETIAGAEGLGATSGARYVLVRELGRGASGVVYLARDRELDRDVAVKLLHPHLAGADQKDACARFFAEARIAASLRHPNIVAIFDLDESARRLIMELGAGGTLRDLLADQGPRSVVRALELHVQVVSALTAAHRRGIVHRDVKPGNLMFRRDPNAPGSEIVLGDFGVANLPEGDQRRRDETAAEHRARGKAIGTLAYMPSEQRQGADVGPWSDLYAASIVLYEMLVGSHPLSRADVLGGRRQRFVLPNDLGDPALISAVQQHIDELSAADWAARPSSEDALAAARELRDRAIALAS